MPSISNRISAEWSPRALRRSLLCVFALTALSIIGLWRTSARAASAPPVATHVILIENMKFSPTTLNVHLGDRIEFKNQDLLPHTATAKDTKMFDSGLLRSGKSWSFSPSAEGTIDYRCSFHPMMEGSIVVQPR